MFLILFNTNFAVGNLQLSIGKLQLSVTRLFFTHDAADQQLQNVIY